MTHHLKFLIIASLFFTGSFLTAQTINEKLFGKESGETSYGGLRLGKNIYVSLLPTGGYISNSVSSDKIYRFDENLNKLDSITISNELGWNHTSGANHMQVLSDSTFGCLMTGGLNFYYLVILDTALTPVNVWQWTFGKDTAQRSFECFYFNNGKLLVGGAVVTDSINPAFGFPALIVLDSLSSKREKVIIPDTLLIHKEVSSIIKHEGNLIAGLGGYGNFYSYVSLNSDYSIDTMMRYPPTSKIHYRSNSLMEINSTGNLVTLGYESFANNFSLLTFDQQLNITQRDTFHMGYNIFWGNDNFAVGSDSSFFMAATLDPVVNLFNLPPGLTRAIRVFKIDEEGNLLWQKDLLDSNYRLVTQIIPSSDGGVFIISQTYIPDLFSSLNVQLSIIKINELGEVENLSFEKNLYRMLSGTELYPNPTNGLLNLIRNDYNFQPIKVKIVDILGRTMQELIIDEQHFQIKLNLPDGQYFIVSEDNDALPFIFKN